MPKSQQYSTGLLLYRDEKDKGPEVFLCHNGGPYFRSKDEGWWSIPKGLPDAGENPLAAAKREFKEEIGFTPEGDFFPLGTVRQKGGKTVEAWAVEGDLPPGWELHCSTYFTIEWPPRSGNMQSFPEIDQARFFTVDEAIKKINEAQATFLDRLIVKMKV